MTQRAETCPLQARLARLARAGSDAARARAREAASALAVDIETDLPDGRAEAAEMRDGAAVTVEAPGLIAREFGTATRAVRPVIGPAVARLTGRG
ncbi:hypothetical protein [Methylobacterium frigidaeris]|uniref:Uncharacterized protein n=1 Tax=Methylobacterium frigidaeris TaxID=2038277 RepID=A0AA37HDP1_9HYPH|nr:hypothetical protein [Methylobacterium frigidaeris]PIK73105.1 hypothetical protein CS379_10280 [Methylobacterium frigidaeris]GJD63330.1 hypothetical protein MPEAHAMD_3496 [Methylobacterium frigidaeris]